MKLIIAFMAFAAGFALLVGFTHFLDEKVSLPYMALGAAGLFIAMVAGMISGK